jgi:hypothetical protein
MMFVRFPEVDPESRAFSAILALRSRSDTQDLVLATALWSSTTVRSRTHSLPTTSSGPQLLFEGISSVEGRGPEVGVGLGTLGERGEAGDFGVVLGDLEQPEDSLAETTCPSSPCS